MGAQLWSVPQRNQRNLREPESKVGCLLSTGWRGLFRDFPSAEAVYREEKNNKPEREARLGLGQGVLNPISR